MTLDNSASRWGPPGGAHGALRAMDLPARTLQPGPEAWQGSGLLSLFIFLSHQIQCNPFVKLVLNSDWQVGRRPTQTSFPSSNLVPEGLCAQMNAILDPLHLSPQ